MTAPERLLFKQTAQGDLHLHIFRPEGPASCAIVFYVCGGWNGFLVEKFFPQSTYLSQRGALCAVAEVRTIEKHGTRPQECVTDAKSAIRFVRQHAAKWNFPADKIVSSGGSAAGHVSLAMAMIPGFEEAGEDTAVSAVSNLACAFNPAVLPPLEQVTSTEERIQSRLDKFGGEAALMALSPTMHVREGLPPVLLMHGDNDVVTPLAETEIFHQKMLAAGNESKLCVYPDGGHGFFNWGDGKNHYFYETLRDMDQFLIDHGFLGGEEHAADFAYAGAFKSMEND